jgi:hypothetical protein
MDRAPTGSVLSAAEIRMAQYLWERHVQAAGLGDPMEAIETGKPDNLIDQLGARKGEKGTS